MPTDKIYRNQNIRLGSRELHRRERRSGNISKTTYLKERLNFDHKRLSEVSF